MSNFNDSTLTLLTVKAVRADDDFATPYDESSHSNRAVSRDSFNGMIRNSEQTPLKIRQPFIRESGSASKQPCRFPSANSATRVSLANRLAASILLNTHEIVNPSPREAAAPSSAQVSSGGLHEESTVFDTMSMDDIIDYLLSAKESESESSRPIYMYVTPRFNVEYVPYPNFYDLVPVDKPGRQSLKMKDLQREAGLCGGKLMQLSLFGLSVVADPRGEGEDALTDFTPLREFVKEKQQVEFLRTGRLFGRFRELRTFYWWRWRTRRNSVERKTAALLQHSFFSEAELMHCQRSIAEICFAMESEVELFCFHGVGSINFMDFLDLQMAKVEESRRRLAEFHSRLGDMIHGQVVAYSSGSKLESSVKAVKNIHPMKEMLKTAADNNVLPEEWMRLRAVQRVTLTFQEKILRIFVVAQYKFDHTIAVILEKFWNRLKLLVSGVPATYRSAQKKEQNYWEVDLARFDKAGRPISPYFRALDAPHASSPSGAAADGASLSLEQVAAMIAAEGAADSATGSSEEGECSGVASVLQAYLDSQHSHLTDAGASSGSAERRAGPTLHKGMKVPDDWDENSSHLSICVHLTSNSKTPISVADLLRLNSVESLAVTISPSKADLMVAMHALCGSLGNLLEQLPNFRRHSFVVAAVQAGSEAVAATSAASAEVPELGIGIVGVDDITEDNISKSSKYFTCLIVHAIFNSTNAYSLAADTLNLVRRAYQEASVLQSYFVKLLEVARKLWYITPQVLAKQMERSLVLGKMKDFIEAPHALEDIKRLGDRDVSRMAAIKSADSFLREALSILEHMKDIKFPLGLIASFRPVLKQLRLYCAMQAKTFHERLPGSFTSRCRMFYDFLQHLDRLYSEQSIGFDALILMMKRVQNFDHCRDVFDAEMDICDALFGIVSKNAASASAPAAEEDSVKLLSSAMEAAKPKGSHGRSSRIDPVRLHAAMLDAVDRMLGSMNRARSLLLSQVQVHRHFLLPP